ncbi:MAG: sigma-70 family RNA polymerase sigma factor [Candidatus Hydrogenedentales bacterium]
MPTRSESLWLREALDRYEGPLVAYAARLTGDLEVGRDAVQDTFMRLWTAKRAEVDDHLAQWLYTVCRNRALDLRAKEQRHKRAPRLVLLQSANGHHQEPTPAAEAETRDRIAAAIDLLPLEQQEPLRLKFEHGLTYRQIAAVLEVSAATVSNRIAAALAAVRDQLSESLDPAVDL